MLDEIASLQPRLLFRHFADILAIPRGSGHEARAREYVIAWARSRGFEALTDAVGNVVVRVPATHGFEGAQTVVLQGHLDMVCEKNADVPHDFGKDPIPAYVDGDLIRSQGTTLGADNGIGIAAAMAAAEDTECRHGPLDLLFTVDEETGLSGAFNLDPSLIRGRILLNLDSEDEGVLYVGCAGGGDTTITLAASPAPVPEGAVCLNIKVSGLKGGHSGLDIHKGRGNAIRILARAVAAGAGLDGFQFGCLEGGNKRNAIPREATGCVYLAADKAEEFVRKVREFADIIRTELGAADPGVTVEVSRDPGACPAMDAATSGRLLRLLLALPHGPLAMSQDIPGLVETSSNLAVLKRDSERVTVLCNSRSSVSTALDAVRLGIVAAGELAGGTAERSGQYPGWRPNVDSPLLALTRKTWAEMTGTEPKVTAIHAGLECGVIAERVPGMDSISFGPTIRGAHSPDERVSIGSTARFYEFLKRLLAVLASQS